VITLTGFYCTQITNLPSYNVSRLQQANLVVITFFDCITNLSLDDTVVQRRLGGRGRRQGLRHHLRLLQRQLRTVATYLKSTNHFMQNSKKLDRFVTKDTYFL